MSSHRRTNDSNLIDRAINYLFPTWGVHRQQARVAQELLNTVSPLKSTRGTGAIPSSPQKSDDRIPYGDRLKMIDLFDTTVNETPIMTGMVDRFVTNVVPPTGLRPVPQTGNDQFDDELQKHFEDYAETAEIRGHSFWQLQQILLKSVLGHGDAGLAHYSPDGLQGVPSCKIATPQKHTAHEGRLVHQGVYTGSGLVPRGYYIIPRDRWGAYIHTKYRYLSTNKMWAFSHPADFESYRGISPFLSSYRHVRMLESILKYKEFQAKMASVFGIAIKKDKSKPTSPLSSMGTGRAAESRGESETTSTRPDIELFAGMGVTLNNDEDLVTVESKINAGDFHEFIRLVARFIGLSAGLPLEFVLLDWTKANYYGNRMAAMMGKRTFMHWWTIPARLTRLEYARYTAALIESGRIKVPAQYDNSPLFCQITLPPPIEVDEYKALQVQRMKMEANLDTGENWIIAQGSTLQRVIKARKKELDLQLAAGLPVPATMTPGVKLLSEIEPTQE